MKNLLLLMVMFVSMAASAQKDVTKFLGIPVDGSKEAVMQKLKNKGFQYNQCLDRLSGEFNGIDVYVSVVTNNNKVWRIAVYDAYTLNERDIKIRFNTLCRQFMKNERYKCTYNDYIIPDDEDISHEMIVNNKRYQASFYQKEEKETIDSVAFKKRLKEALLEEFTQEEIDNPTEEQKEKIKAIKEGVLFTLKFNNELFGKKSVWFMIHEEYGSYRILMYYDNEYNRADGEDL